MQTISADEFKKRFGEAGVSQFQQSQPQQSSFLQKAGGFAMGVAKDAANVGVRAGTRIAEAGGTLGLFGKEAKQGYDIMEREGKGEDVLGFHVPRVGSYQQAAGEGAEMASWLLPAGGGAKVVAQGLKQGLRAGVKGGAIVGGTSGVLHGAGTAMQEGQGAFGVAGRAATEGAAGTVLGAGGGAIAPLAGAGLRGARAGAESMEHIISRGIDTARGATQGAREVGGMLGREASRIPARIGTNIAEKRTQNAAIQKLPTPTARRGASDGVDVKDVDFIYKIPASQRPAMRKLANVVQKFEKGETTTNPIEVIGKPIVKRLQELQTAASKKGAELGDVAGKLGVVTQDETMPAVFGRLKKVPGLQGLKADKNGALDFSNTVLATGETKSDRKAIQEIFTNATRWGSGSKKHLLRQELFESLGGKKRSQMNLTATQEKAYQAIREGLSDLLESKHPQYKKLSGEYRQIISPLQEMRKMLRATGHGDEEDVMDMSAGLLARRLTSLAQSNPQIRRVLKDMDKATQGGTTRLSVETMQDFYNVLEKYYDVAPKTGFQAQVKRGVESATSLTQAAMGAVRSVAGETPAVRRKALEGMLDEVLGGTKKNLSEAFNKFDRQPNLSAEDKKVEDASIKKYLTSKKALAEEYVQKFGNKVANADLARRLFRDVGYTGKNSAAVHEAASALNKDVWKLALKNLESDAVIYAGGSGSGKSTAVQTVLPNIEQSAAAILDGNLSKLSSAEARIKEAVDAGKRPKIVFVYRDPTDAWVNGVIKRMRDNKEEDGRVVPMSTFLENAPGSLKVVKQLKAAGFEVGAVDNSLGAGKAQIMSDAKLAALAYPADMRAILTRETKKLLDGGEITTEEYDALIQ